MIRLFEKEHKTMIAIGACDGRLVVDKTSFGGAGHLLLIMSVNT